VGLISNLKTIWKNRSAIKAVSKAVNEVKEGNLKSGWKTTEFWLTVLTNAGAIVTALNGVLDPKTAAIIMAVVNGVYSVLRAALKSGAQEEKTA